MARKKRIDPAHLQMARQAGEAAKFLRVLSNTHRLRVLCLLLEGEMSVGELNELIPVSQSVLSQHLAVLRERELVSTRRSAQTIYYSVPAGPVHTVIAALHSAFCPLPAADSRASARRSRVVTCRPQRSAGA